MIPLKGVPDWSPVQQHAAEAFLFEEENDVVAYQMDPGSGKTTLLLGLIALGRLYTEKRKRVLLLVDGSMVVDWLYNRLEELTGIPYDDDYTITSFMDRVSMYPFEKSDWILIDGCDNRPNSDFFARILPMLKHGRQRVLFLYADETPAHLKIRYTYSKQTIATLYKTDYPNATRQAIYAFILCARRLRFHRDVIVFICKMIESTRRDVSWLDLEYPLKEN